MLFKVRPFKEILTHPSKQSAVEVVGWIEDCMFFVSFLGKPYRIPTSSINEDEHGKYAFIQLFQAEVKTNWVLSVQPEFEEEDLEHYGCQISLDFNPDLPRAQLSLAQRGLNPDKHHLFVPLKSGLSIYFDSDGIVNGSGYLGKAELNEDLQV